MNAKDLYLAVYENIKKYTNILELKSTTEIILEEIFKCNIKDVIKNKEIEIENEKVEKIIKNISLRLKKNEPIQYIVGMCNFLDCKILLNKNVLIPRQETEEMVYNILKLNLNNKKIIDICSGSGCIGISIKKKYQDSNVTCVDIDKKAILLSKKNSKINNTKIHFVNMDIFNNEIFNIGLFDVIVSNPPYIPESKINTLEKKIINFEPHIALFVKNENPLIFYSQIKNIIEHNLSSNGIFFIEIPEYFEKEIITLFKGVSFIKKVIVNKDLNNKSRWISGEKL